ncbi:MAG: ribonuclease P protein component [Bacteroidales bacterium]|nr:ribonuclease P protein component [Bacteroidales bacterium]
MTFAFEKKQHLAKRETIAALASHGKVLFKYPIKAYWMPTEDVGYARYVVTVPKKEFKRAVRRNLLKRRMREALRLNQAECLQGACGDFLLIYIAREICDYATIEAAVRDILKKSAAK